jgi:hypothetical protein
MQWGNHPCKKNSEVECSSGGSNGTTTHAKKDFRNSGDGSLERG